VIRILGSVIECIRPGCDENEIASTGYSLRKTEFCRLWLATLLSGTFVLAEDVTGTWLMYNLGGSAFLLSLTASAASAPLFFLFTLPAGAVADIVNRRTLIVRAVLWQRRGQRSLLSGRGRADVIKPSAVLAWVFVLGIGLAFGAPAWEPSFQTSSPVRIGTSSEF
jgi:hypothetical protein